MLTALDVRYDAWLSGGFGALRDAWRSRSSTIGTRVGLPDGGDGVAVDVDGDGALLVDVGGGALTRVMSRRRSVTRPEGGRPVLLVIEVGNTNTGVGVYDGQRLLVSWRLTSRREQTADEYGVFIQTLLRTRGIEPQHVTGVAISNVVPPVQRTLEWMSEAYFGIHPFTVQPGVNVDVPLNVDNPTGGRGRPRLQYRGGRRDLRHARSSSWTSAPPRTSTSSTRGASSSAGRSRPASCSPRRRSSPARRGSPGWRSCAPRTPSAATPSPISSRASCTGMPGSSTGSSSACAASSTATCAWSRRAGFAEQMREVCQSLARGQCRTCASRGCA